MKLMNPIPNGKISNSMLSKTVEISSYNSDLIFSPAQGTIVSSNKFKCDGNIKIEHYIDGNTYYSDFCKVNKIMSIRGSQVRQGEVRRLRSGRDGSQDGRCDVSRHPRSGHKAR